MINRIADERWLLRDVDDDENILAVCDDIEGLFVDPPYGPGTTLLGCRPHPPLSRALDALAAGEGRPGGARHRRQVNVKVCSVNQDGVVHGVVGAYLQALVVDVRPSAVDAGLVDVTFDAGIADPMPRAARPIWDLWYSGGPAEAGLWAGYHRELRHQWSGAALAHRAGAPDKPAGSTYHLDGRHVTDVEGFYCAIGEAVNGPGGYFGWNGAALVDCLRGRWGAESPFRLVWHDAEVARTHGLERVVRWLTEDGVDVELR